MIDFVDLFDWLDDSSLELQRPVCPVHFIELPVSGTCGECR